MKLIHAPFWPFAAWIGFLPAFAEANNAEREGARIAREVNAYNKGYQSERCDVQMILMNAHGDQSIRKLSTMVIEDRDSNEKSRIEFQWPPDVRGTRLLTWSHGREADDQWLYLPSLRRVKRINSHSRTGSFMGSEFSYEDLGSQEPGKFQHVLLAEESLNGRATWKLQRTPSDKTSAYSKQIVWIDKQYRAPLVVDYYNTRGERLKTATFTGYTQHGKYWRYGTVSMVNHKTKKRSDLRVSKRALKVSFDEEAFDKDELDR